MGGRRLRVEVGSAENDGIPHEWDFSADSGFQEGK